MNRPKPHPAASHAFTLIELLVVIAIIGILAGLLMPVLSKAKSNAAKVTDINNLRQMMMAVSLYCQDSADVLPWPNWARGDVDPDTGVSRVGWLYTLNRAAVGPARYNPRTGSMWTYMLNEKMYFCPQDQRGITSRSQQSSSYAMNGAVCGYDSIVYPPIKLGLLRSSDCAFWETDETNPNYFNDGANYPTEGVSARHLQGAIQAAFDGSVSFVSLLNWYNDVADPNRNRLWCFPGSPDGRTE